MKVLTHLIALLSLLTLNSNSQTEPFEVSEPIEENIRSKVPSLLKPWTKWVTWEEERNRAPFIYNDKSKKIKAWNSGLFLDVNQTQGSFLYSVEVFQPSWLVLPGDRNAWPIEVTSNGKQIPVLSNKNNLPQIFLEKGTWSLSGKFRWDKIPQTMTLPKSVGILNLTREKEQIKLPSWNASGKLWLSRTNTETTEENYLSAKVYRHLNDGAPVWLDTDIELTVTGKSREEVLGNILPEGWQIATVSAPIPTAIDDKGLVKTQVRAGKWFISIRAFRTTPPSSMQYPEGAKPIVEEEFISLQNRPNFRLIEFRDIIAVDAAQTTFPDKWKSYPLHLWTNSKPFKIEEKLRGMGEKKAPGVSISRQFWLDMNGKKLTYKDLVTGSGLQTWRLDAAEGQELGAAKVGGESQLITKNPLNGAIGLEVRVRGELFLPPGWRAFAILGPDETYGDWMSNWSLLDFFFLLIFTVSLWKIVGWKGALIGCLTFVLCYHESGAPRIMWVLLLGVIALLKALPENKLRLSLRIGAYSLSFILAMMIIPFASNQLRQALYPQLEPHSIVGTRDYTIDTTYFQTLPETETNAFLGNPRSSKSEKFSEKNFKYDSKAKIQTGPAVPEWSWRSVSFSWSGPVNQDEKVSFILIPRWLQAIIAVLRVITMMALFYGLIRLLRLNKSWGRPDKKKSNKKSVSIATSAFLCALFIPQLSEAQDFPSEKMLQTLKARLDNSPKGLSEYAQIPQVTLSLDGRSLSMEVEVHTADSTAVPLPGKLPSWSPIRVTNQYGKSLSLVRQNGFLWVPLEKGTHQLSVTGIIPSSEWTWDFLLKPQYVTINAPGWTVTGMKPNGIPEAQVFFNEQNRSEDEEAAYDRKDFSPIFEVDRTLELGLIWEATTTVNRLAKSGKAVTVSLPLLPGERIITPGFEAKNGRIEIRLGTNQQSISWQSELKQSPQIELAAEENNKWVEKWSVITSSVWNLSIDGLAPIYSRGESEIIPTWHPWSNGSSNEKVTLQIARPEAIEGDTLTIRQAIHRMNLGSRQRNSSLDLSLQTSLGRDFILGLHPEASVTSLKINKTEASIRKEGNNIIIPLRPGEQNITLEWKTPDGIKFRSLGDEVTLPVECSNTSTIIQYSNTKRLALWTTGPLRGPAIQMWPLFIIAILVGVSLGRVKHSPLKTYEWILLFIGLTQIPVIMAGLIAFWLFWVSFKQYDFIKKLPNIPYNLYQLATVFGVVPFLGILLFALYKGLLGTPEMRIMGEGSLAGYLEWFLPRGSDLKLPQPEVFTISIWFFRAIMLLWSVWLAFALLKWAKWTWNSLSENGFWHIPKKNKPSLPSVDTNTEKDSSEKI